MNRVFYFTARVDGGHHTESADSIERQKASRRRQFDYLKAIETLQTVTVVEGRFLRKRLKCRDCGHTRYVPEEKKSDVNIATQLMADAFHDRFDIGVVVSGDSDLSDAIRLVREEFREKQLIVAFPPTRKSKELRTVATNSIDVWRKTLRKCQFPDSVPIGRGAVRRPNEWT